MTLYDAVSGLPLVVDDYGFELRERDTSSGFTRTTTVVSLRGDGETGLGEDVTYANEAHYALQDADPDLPLAGEHTFDSFSGTLADLDLFHGTEPDRPSDRHYRRWGFESAALDLALRQAGTDLGAALSREYDPVEFVVSTRLDGPEDSPPTAARVKRWLDIDPGLGFKLDPTTDWTADLVSDLAATGRVRIVDLKGRYEGTAVDNPADPELYRLVLDGFPDALVEDPNLTEETRPLFDGHEDRVSWDAPITGVESIESLPFEPEWLNIKPSRFGSVRSLFDSLEYCMDRDVGCYGGGQFELDVGRGQIQALASLFYADSPNDVAPGEYNRPEPSAGLPRTPLSPPASPEGFRWD